MIKFTITGFSNEKQLILTQKEPCGIKNRAIWYLPFPYKYGIFLRSIHSMPDTVAVINMSADIKRGEKK
jgi:hypothetical protein